MAPSAYAYKVCLNSEQTLENICLTVAMFQTCRVIVRHQHRKVFTKESWQTLIYSQSQLSSCKKQETGSEAYLSTWWSVCVHRQVVTYTNPTGLKQHRPLTIQRKLILGWKSDAREMLKHAQNANSNATFVCVQKFLTLKSTYIIITLQLKCAVLRKGCFNNIMHINILQLSKCKESLSVSVLMAIFQVNLG